MLRVHYFKRVDWHLHNIEKIKAAGRDDWILCGNRIVVAPHRWAHAYEMFCADYPECCRLIDLHYRQRIPWHGVCDEMFIEQPTFYRMKNEIVLVFATYASAEGLAVLGGQ